MKKTSVAAGLAVAFLLFTPGRADADVTAFFGVSPTPDTRGTRGAAFGINLLVIGFEFEYASTSADEAAGAPSLRTGMINGLVQTPTTSTQFYLTAGGGFYRERLLEDGETNFGTNIGGGVKIGLAGPLRLRLDYRIFTLRGSPLYKTPQRFYGGLNLAF